MNEPPKTLTQAVDDLRLIRQVLDQTATSFRTLAPEFFRMGVVWLVYGVLSCLVIWPDTLAFLFPEAFAGWDPTTGLPRVLSALAVCSAFGPGLVPVLATILPLYAFLVGVGLVQVFYQPVALLVLARRLRRRPEGV